MDGDTDVTPKTARRRNQFMTTHSRRGVRSVTVCEFVAFVLIGLWRGCGVSFGQKFELLRSRVPAPNGVHPKTGLLEPSHGRFYGTTAEGRTARYRTVL